MCLIIKNGFLYLIFLTDAKYNTDNPSRAAALNSINEIKSKLKKASSNNEQTKAHRANLSFLIEKALVIK